ncbi:hypothetical protein C8N35_10556 [Breoghania corrubedonensis]|uniref:Lipoprotein n=1 Tax=Breoghania corrubedonensis TaxID=665038 RepID=A0A2T5V8H0_9HYPH|nr:hypothetical protein [Breoghania corrubedonensis]PTW60056.1 hypothetical protein C8N35_10556 [Breoghania corrubedonensis]
MRHYKLRAREALLLIALGAAGSGLAGCAGQAANSPASWYGQHKLAAPHRDKVVICHGFGCALRTTVPFSARDLAKLKGILAKGAKSPAAEREAIARAVQWQERRVAPAVGSANDKGGFTFDSGVTGQMDCIDEATNTTSLLIVAERHGMLKHHFVRSPVARGFFLDGRYPHATAVVAEKKGGRTYAIDSWTHDNGERPDVMTLNRWFAENPGG